MSIEEEIAGLERDERALEKCADALSRLATVAERFYCALYPEPKRARDAKVTQLRTPDQEVQEETIQGSESSIEQWKDIGPREHAFIESQKKEKKSS